MSTETQEQAEAVETGLAQIIVDLRTLDAVKFNRKYSKQQMLTYLLEHGVDEPEDNTKAGLRDALIGLDEMEGPDAEEEAVADPGSQAKPRTSSIEDPVDYVWRRTDELATAARKAKQPAPRRKDVTAQLISEGVAYHTARTQYQAWFKHTDSGRKLMSEGNARPVKAKKS